MLTGTPGRSGDEAAALEAVGCSAGLVTETAYDPFLALSEAASRTTTLRLGTSIAVALARSPMTVALTANHLQLATEGRFMLGLGSQVKAHVVRRFSMPWSRPAARMREHVLAVRAIWRAWDTGERLDFQGEFYSHTLMAPLFDPGPNPFGNPPVLMSGVGPGMTETAGEVADGFLAAPLAPPGYIRDRVLPWLQTGHDRAGRSDADFVVSAMPFVATGRSQAELDEAVEANRARVAFYASTPAYAAVLEHYGLTALQERLTELSRRQEWAEMTALVSDDVLEVFAVVGPADRVLGEVQRRYRGLVDRVTLYAADGLAPDLVGTVLAGAGHSAVTASPTTASTTTASTTTAGA
jgi:probable F420-dependent oxidoreductase